MNEENNLNSSSEPPTSKGILDNIQHENKTQKETTEDNHQNPNKDCNSDSNKINREYSEEKAEPNVESKEEPKVEDRNESNAESKIETKEEPKEEAIDYKSKYFYLAAEMDNIYKRFQREKEGIIKFGNEKLLTDLLEVIDNFDRTLQALGQGQDEGNERLKNLVTGINMVYGQFSNILGRYGLASIKSVGEIFDPNLHEAVAERSVEGKPELEIVEEYQRGYTLHNRVLRASKVVVNRVH